MLHLKSFSVVSIIFLFFFISSCNKNNVVSPVISPQKQISRIVQDVNNYSTFSYTNGKLSEFKTIAESKPFRTIALNYDGKSRPQTENYKTDFEDLLKKYYYDSSSKLDSMEFMLKDSINNYQLYGKLKYYYNILNQLIKTEQYNNEGILMFTTEYKYDENVNISEVRFYDSKGLKEITTKTYDNKKNPWYELKDWLNYDVAVSKNNVQSISSTYYNGQENSETKHTYTYDSDGYPITKKIEYITNSIHTTLNETYEYQSME